MSNYWKTRLPAVVLAAAAGIVAGVLIAPEVGVLVVPGTYLLAARGLS